MFLNLKEERLGKMKLKKMNKQEIDILIKITAEVRDLLFQLKELEKYVEKLWRKIERYYFETEDVDKFEKH